MPDCLAGAARTASGRVILYAVATGARYERGDEQAAEMVRSGAFAVTHPDERTPVPAPVPAAPSRKRS